MKKVWALSVVRGLTVVMVILAVMAITVVLGGLAKVWLRNSGIEIEWDGLVVGLALTVAYAAASIACLWYTKRGGSDSAYCVAIGYLALLLAYASISLALRVRSTGSYDFQDPASLVRLAWILLVAALIVAVWREARASGFLRGQSSRAAPEKPSHIPDDN